MNDFILIFFMGQRFLCLNIFKPIVIDFLIQSMSSFIFAGYFQSFRINRSNYKYNLQNLVKMQLDEVKEILFDSGLNFNESLVKDVHEFLTEQTFPVACESNLSKKYKIYSASAIVSELKLIPKLHSLGFAKCGIHIENIMSHLPPQLSKEQFLQVLKKMTQKSQVTTPTLSNKIDNIQVSYRIFKKYRKAFEELWLYVNIAKLVMNDMLSIFWIVYLLIKNKNQVELYINVAHQLKMILALLRSVFQCLIAHVDETTFSTAIKDIFNIDIGIDEQFLILHQSNIEKQLNSINQRRYPDQKLNFDKFSRNAFLIAKILDDASNAFHREDYLQFDLYIDQISYLQLRTALVPQGFKKINKAIQPIRKTINFEENEQHPQNLNTASSDKTRHQMEIQSPTSSSKEKSNLNLNQSCQIDNTLISPTAPKTTQNMSDLTPIRKSKNNDPTPLHSRLANLQFVKKKVDCVNNQQSKLKLQKIFKIVYQNIKINSQQYQGWAKNQILSLINQHNSTCIKKQNRINQIYLFFTYFVIKIYEFYSEEENIAMFSQKKVFNSILCLSTDIFNYAYRSQQLSYSQQCEYFQISLIQALKPINWMGKNIDKPKQINTYLYSLQKKIIIKEIWQDKEKTGYNIVQSQQQYKISQSDQIGYTDKVIWSRLNRHILDRVEQLSKQVQIEPKMIKRIQNFVSIILKQKPNLLKNNKIDQIIVCCITSFLSINQIQSKQTLQKVFNSYNNIEFGFQNNKDGLKTAQGKQMSLIEFYNSIFLDEVQDIINNKKQSNFLLTPNRLNRHKLLDEQKSLTPLAQKFKESTMRFNSFARRNSQSGIGGNEQKLPQFKFSNIFSKNNEEKGSQIHSPLLTSSLKSPGTNYRQNLFLSSRLQSQKKQRKQNEQMQAEQSHSQSFSSKSSQKAGSHTSSHHPISENQPINELKKTMSIKEQNIKQTKMERNFSFGKYADS